MWTSPAIYGRLQAIQGRYNAQSVANGPKCVWTFKGRSKAIQGKFTGQSRDGLMIVNPASVYTFPSALLREQESPKWGILFPKWGLPFHITIFSDRWKTSHDPHEPFASSSFPVLFTHLVSIITCLASAFWIKLSVLFTYLPTILSK